MESTMNPIDMRELDAARKKRLRRIWAKEFGKSLLAFGAIVILLVMWAASFAVMNTTRFP